MRRSPGERESRSITRISRQSSIKSPRCLNRTAVNGAGARWIASRNVIAGVRSPTNTKSFFGGSARTSYHKLYGSVRAPLVGRDLAFSNRSEFSGGEGDRRTGCGGYAGGEGGRVPARRGGSFAHARERRGEVARGKQRRGGGRPARRGRDSAHSRYRRFSSRGAGRPARL